MRDRIWARAQTEDDAPLLLDPRLCFPRAKAALAFCICRASLSLDLPLLDLRSLTPGRG
jgi:hypothetical protein